MSRTQRSAWGVASGLAFTVVTLITGLVSTPWILHWLGPERFGTFKVLMDWIAYLALLDLGMSGSVIARLAPVVGRDDRPAVRALLAASLRLYLWLMAVMLLAGVGVVFVLPYVVPAYGISATEMRIAGLLLLLPLLLTPSSVFRALAEARQRVYRVSLLLTLQAVLTTGLLILTAWLGWGLVGQSIATFLAQIPAAVVLVRDGLRDYRGVWRERPSGEAMRSVWSLNWPTFTFTLSSRFALHSDTVIVAWAMGPLLVTPFVLTQRLISIGLTQLQGVGNATWAGLVELHSQGHDATFARRVAELTAMISGLGAVGLGLIAVFNAHFIARWVGAPNYAGDLVTVIACVNAWALAIFSLWGWLLSGTGNIGRWVPYALWFMAVNVTVSVGGTLLWGLVGPLLGTLVGFAAVHAWGMPRVLRSIFGIGVADLWRPALTPLVWALPYVAVWWLIAREQGTLGWAALLAQMTVSGVGGLTLWWFLGLGPQARTVWRDRFQVAFGR